MEGGREREGGGVKRREGKEEEAGTVPLLLANILAGLVTLTYGFQVRQGSQIYLWTSPFFFFFCVPSYIYGLHHSSSSSAFPAISMSFNILVGFPSCISGLHHYHSSSAFPAISLDFTILILLLRSQLYLWTSPFFFFFCVSSYIYVLQHPCGLCQLYLWASPLSFFFGVPSYISGLYHSYSSSVFPAISLGFTIFSSSAFPAISFGFTILNEIFASVTVLSSNH